MLFYTFLILPESGVNFAAALKLQQTDMFGYDDPAFSQISVITHEQLMPTPSNRDTQATSSDIGILGEELVARWVQQQGWSVLHRRWHCRFGELDLVLARKSRSSPEIIEAVTFVEVKTRRRNNWDADGKLAVTSQKQTRLWKAAQLFLVQHPMLAELPCQFDVAIVACEPLSTSAKPTSNASGETVLILKNYRLTLLEYIPAAFSQM